jgi:cyclopropane fatty-acyl-phospholipid synthase-like methyltransferase
MSLIFGCVALTDMTKLDPHRYPLKVRQGDIIDKYIFDEMRIPYSDTHKKLFHTDYVDPRAADAWVKDYVEKHSNN